MQKRTEKEQKEIKRKPMGSHRGTKKQPKGNKLEPNAPERKLNGSQGKPKGVNKELKGS